MIGRYRFGNIITSINDHGVQQGDNTLAGKYSLLIFKGKNPIQSEHNYLCL